MNYERYRGSDDCSVIVTIPGITWQLADSRSTVTQSSLSLGNNTFDLKCKKGEWEKLLSVNPSTFQIATFRATCPKEKKKTIVLFTSQSD